MKPVPTDEQAPRARPRAEHVSAAQQLRTLLDLSQALTSALELDEMLGVFVRQANELSYADSTVLSIYDRERDAVKTLVQVTESGAARVRPDGETYPLAQFPATRRALESRELTQVRVSNPDDDPEERALLRANGYCAMLMLPLVGRGEVVGLMEVYDIEDRRFEPDVVDFCKALCAIVGIALRNATLYAEMQKLATQDSLTGLGNRALFEEQLAAAAARSARSGEPLALLLVDLDGLKQINDAWGHAAGDVALRALGRSLSRAIRAGDLACRLGGDEFAVILPAAVREDALRIAERTRERLKRTGSYRISGGVADYTPRNGSAADPAGLYSAADRAAYLAKRAGGSRIL